MKLTIRNKAILATVSAALVIIAAMGTYSFNSSWNILIDKTFQRELPAVLGRGEQRFKCSTQRPRHSFTSYRPYPPLFLPNIQAIAPSKKFQRTFPR